MNSRKIFTVINKNKWWWDERFFNWKSKPYLKIRAVFKPKFIIKNYFSCNYTQIISIKSKNCENARQTRKPKNENIKILKYHTKQPHHQPLSSFFVLLSE